MDLPNSLPDYFVSKNLVVDGKLNYKIDFIFLNLIHIEFLSLFYSYFFFVFY